MPKYWDGYIEERIDKDKHFFTDLPLTNILMDFYGFLRDQGKLKRPKQIRY